MKLSDPILRPPDEWTSEEMRTISNNLYEYDKIFSYRKGLENPCSNPFCNFPLTSSNNFTVVGYGDVCGLCHDIHTSLSGRSWFVTAHVQWQAGQDKINRMKGGL